MDLALNNLQRLIRHKTNKPNQTNEVSSTIFKVFGMTQPGIEDISSYDNIPKIQ